ncbi:MAG: D-alanine--D-alanine ligase [Desulfobia sp.]
MSKRLRLALIAGGKSGEREISLKGAREVLKALNTNKYKVRQYDPVHDLERLAGDAPKTDVAFILLHGPMGEDGSIQGFLDLLGVPYQGSGLLGSALAMNKHLSKLLYQQSGLKTAESVLLTPHSGPAGEEISEKLGLPLVIKPVSQGSSLGLNIIHNLAEFGPALSNSFQIDREVLVEPYIKGREITVGVIGNQKLTALPVVEIIPDQQHPFFDYTAKYTPGATSEICPADFPEEITFEARDYGVKAHRALGLRGYSRTDMIVSETGEIFIMETNTIPGMAATSLFPLAAQEYGLSFSALIDRLIELAIEYRT